MEAVRLPAKIGIVVGLAAEARIARPAGRVMAGGGTAIGAQQAANRLITEGVSALVSFGLAGGLDPGLRPGRLVVPRYVLDGNQRFSADQNMLEALGGPTVDLVLAAGEIAQTAAAKAALWQQTGAAAVDLESGAVARVARRHGLPFAVLRAVCDPAERGLPPAALLALDQAGAIRVLKVLASVAAAPSQIPSLLALARDAAIARRALIRRVAELHYRLAGM
jgi:adenosylhomocysteine nucleosidase